MSGDRQLCKVVRRSCRDCPPTKPATHCCNCGNRSWCEMENPMKCDEEGTLGIYQSVTVYASTAEPSQLAGCTADTHGSCNRHHRRGLSNGAVFRPPRPVLGCIRFDANVRSETVTKRSCYTFSSFWKSTRLSVLPVRSGRDLFLRTSLI